MRDAGTALGLIGAEMIRFGDPSPVFLVPAAAPDLVAALYRCGARNCELHVAQSRGPAQAPRGIVMPTFMPETG